jgi:hypothetical protein
MGQMYSALHSLTEIERARKPFFWSPPENRLDSQLVHRLNHDTNIVTQHLTQYFVDLRYLFLAHQSCTELFFDHRERCLDVAQLVVVPLKPLFIVSVKVVHSGPERIVTLMLRLRVNFERDIGRRLLSATNRKFARLE